MGQRHDRPMINIFTLDARVNEQGGEYAGLDRYEARRQIKAKLEELGWARGSEELTHNVSVSQRSGEVVEPMLSRQYFVRTQPLAERANAALRSGETRIIPEGWVKTWDHFMDNLRDWCISRQLWWGHRIPVFYDLERLPEVLRGEVRAGEALEALEAGRPLPEVLTIALNTLDEEEARRVFEALESMGELAELEDSARQEPPGD